MTYTSSPNSHDLWSTNMWNTHYTICKAQLGPIQSQNQPKQNSTLCINKLFMYHTNLKSIKIIYSSITECKVSLNKKTNWLTCLCIIPILHMHTHALTPDSYIESGFQICSLVFYVTLFSSLHHALILNFFLIWHLEYITIIPALLCSSKLY